MKTKLSEIFISTSKKNDYSKKELLNLDIRQEYIEAVACKTGLAYSEKNLLETNLCYLNSDEIRPEYKLFFTKADLVRYLDQALSSDHYKLAEDELPFQGKTLFIEIEKAKEI